MLIGALISDSSPIQSPRNRTVREYVVSLETMESHLQSLSARDIQLPLLRHRSCLVAFTTLLVFTVNPSIPRESIDFPAGYEVPRHSSFPSRRNLPTLSPTPPSPSSRALCSLMQPTLRLRRAGLNVVSRF